VCKETGNQINNVYYAKKKVDAKQIQLLKYYIKFVIQFVSNVVTFFTDDKTKYCTDFILIGKLVNIGLF